MGGPLVLPHIAVDIRWVDNLVIFIQKEQLNWGVKSKNNKNPVRLLFSRYATHIIGILKKKGLRRVYTTLKEMTLLVNTCGFPVILLVNMVCL